MLPVLHAGPAPWTWVSGVRVPDYSSGLALQAVGVRIRRSRSVALDGILGVAMTLYALLVSDFLGTVASLLQVMVALPRTAPTWRGTAGYTTRNGRSGRRKERADDLAAWREMLLDRFAGTPEDELLDRLVASPALAGPELNFLRARIAQRRGDVSQAATLVTKCLKELPGRQAYLDFAVKVGAELPSRAREIAAERARAAEYLRTT